MPRGRPVRGVAGETSPAAKSGRDFGGGNAANARLTTELQSLHHALGLRQCFSKSPCPRLSNLFLAHLGGGRFIPLLGSQVAPAPAAALLQVVNTVIEGERASSSTATPNSVQLVCGLLAGSLNSASHRIYNPFLYRKVLLRMRWH